MMKQVPKPNMMSGAVVTKASPVVVRPSESELGTPPPIDTVALSPFDRREPHIPVASLLVFKHAIDEPVETIKRPLSRALAHYRPVAGRLDGAGGSIACTDEGVTFVGASASCALEEATATAALHQMDLAARYPGPLCRDADPLLLVQVTEFACGGFVVGATSNHVLADGVGVAQFLQAVAELARGVSPPSVVPIRRWDDGSLRASSSPIPAARRSKPTAGDEAQDLARLDMVVPSSLISRIKAGGFGGGAEPCCTVLEAVLAVLWRCRTRAAVSPDGADSPAHLNFVCDVRSRVGAPAGYYGNCIRLQVVPATAGAVAGSSIGHLVQMIRRAKKKVPDLLRPDGGGGAAAAADHQAPAPRWYEAFPVTDWRNLGLHAVDFGSGVPARVVWHTEHTMVPFCVVPPRRPGRDDGVEVSSMFLKREHVDAFLGEFAALAASPAAE